MRLLICAALAAVLAGCADDKPAEPARSFIPVAATTAGADPFVVRGQGLDDLQSRTGVLAVTSYTITAARACRLRSEAWSFYLTSRLFATVDVFAAEMPGSQASGPEGVKSFVNGAIFAAAHLATWNVRAWGVVICPVLETDQSLRTLDEIAR